MTILVTGSTGKVGELVLERLSGQGVAVKALARDPSKLALPDGIDPVRGDMLDPPSMRAALAAIDTLFLLNAVVPDEVMQALLTLDLAHEAGIRRLVYFSVFGSAAFTAVPHFTGKRAVEAVIDERSIPATVLRPAYFIQNDMMFADAVRTASIRNRSAGLASRWWTSAAHLSRLRRGSQSRLVGEGSPAALRRRPEGLTRFDYCGRLSATRRRRQA